MHKENGSIEIGKYKNNLKDGKALQIFKDHIEVILYQNDQRSNLKMHHEPAFTQLSNFDENLSGKSVIKTQNSKEYCTYINNVK